MSQKILSILISTVDDKILFNKHLLNIDTSIIEVIIIQQLINSDKKLEINKEGYTIVSIKEKGLSKSRNRAMDLVKTPWALYCDDDLTYKPDFYEIICNSISEYPEVDIFNYKVALTTGGFFKKYEEKPYKHSLRTLLKVSSWDYIVKVEKLKKMNIEQDLCFGLGSFYDQGENNIFLTDLFRAGMNAMYIPEILVSHPPENSGWDMSNRRLFSKGAVFTRIYGVKGLLYSTAFSILKYKMYKNQNNFLSAFYYLNKGALHYLFIGKSKKC